MVRGITQWGGIWTREKNILKVKEKIKIWCGEQDIFGGMNVSSGSGINLDLVAQIS